MTMRMSAKLVFLAWSVALTNLRAAGPAVEPATKSAASLTNPAMSDHTFPEGEGGEASNPASRAATNLNAWHSNFSARLDESIQQLRTNTEQEKTAAVIVTWGRASESASESAFLYSLPKMGRETRFPHLADILRENGLPPSLVGVVAVESGFNPVALSPKGARGLWQLMPATARRYGLLVGPQLDERTDPVKSTQAAAAYMKDLFGQFQDWPLALAAYNAGEERVERAIVRTGTRDFWTLRRRAALPDETLRYVPAVMAKLQSPLSLWTPASATVFGKGPSPRGQVVYAATTTPPGVESK